VTGGSAVCAQAAAHGNPWTAATTARPVPNTIRRARRAAAGLALTGLLDLSGWPVGMRVIVRRERACHSICVNPGWSIIGPPFVRTEGVICDQGHNVAGSGEGGSAVGGDGLGRDAGLVDQGRGELGHPPIDGADGLLNELTRAVLERALHTRDDPSSRV